MKWEIVLLIDFTIRDVLTFGGQVLFKLISFN